MGNRPRGVRRLLQFSLRTFLVVLTAACIWLGIKTDRVRRQREVVRIVQNLGGEIAFDYQYQGFLLYQQSPYQTVSLQSPPGPAVLRMVLGDDYFADLAAVRIENASDREAVRLAKQATIRQLALSGPLGDEGLEAISRLTNLERLELHGGRFTAAGLSKLANLRHLRSLTIGDTTLSDDDARSIGRLVTLEELSLTNTRLASRQLGYFKEFPRITMLDLSDTLVGDKGLEALHGLRSLTFVRLDKTMVTAKGIKKLREALPEAQILPGVVGNELF